MKVNVRLLTGVAAAALGLGCLSEAALAQTAPSDTPAQGENADEGNLPGDDIVVTARKRQETTLSAPVVINAFSGEQLSRAGVSSINDLARLTPQLKTFTNIGVNGGFSAIRGITSPSGNASTDPAVLVVINNVPVGTGGAMLLGQFDLGQAEILKGPQALFFGKNATAGIISLTTAEPTGEFDAMLRGEYEIEARQIVTEGFASGPLSDTLRGRLAVKYSHMDGDFTNGVAAAHQQRGPNTNEVGIRGTLIFEPSSDLTMKLKGTYSRINDGGPFVNLQRMYCPNGGVPSGASVTAAEKDCSLDGRYWRMDLPLNAGTASNNSLFPNDGKPYYKMRQWLFSLDTTYKPFEGVALTSVTGYYKQDASTADNNALGLPVLFAAMRNDQYIVSEELRLASDTSGPLSWMLGGFYQYNSLVSTEAVDRYNPTTGAFTVFAPGIFDIKSTTWSGFAQGSYEFGGGFNASAGVRFTDDVKTQNVNLSSKFRPRMHASNWSPEFTLSYRPTQDLNVYASYKQAYKSGSFQVASLGFLAPIANPAVSVVENSYRPETVDGFEGGIKAAIFDRQLRVEFSGYSYKYKDLQLSQLDPTSAVNRINNASGATVKGVEFSANYAPREVPGLRLFGTVAYNDAKYTDFIAGCYTGQTLAQGCTIDSVDAGTVPDQQSLSGHSMMKAPKWSLTTGFNLSSEIGNNLKLGFDTRFSYETKSFLTQENIPWGVRPAGGMIDAGITFGSTDDAWELGLIGKNLTNARYAVHGIQGFGSGNATTTGTAVGSPSDFVGYAPRGREIRLRLTIHPAAL